MILKVKKNYSLTKRLVRNFFFLITEIKSLNCKSFGNSDYFLFFIATQPKVETISEEVRVKKTKLSEESEIKKPKLIDAFRTANEKHYEAFWKRISENLPYLFRDDGFEFSGDFFEPKEAKKQCHFDLENIDMDIMDENKKKSGTFIQFTIN